MNSFIKAFLIVILTTLQVHLPLLNDKAWAQNATLLPNAMQQFLDNNGNPLTSGTVDTYIPSTTTRKTTWQDAGKTTANTNPIQLDAAGRALIFGDGSYRQVVKDEDGNTIWDQVTASYATPGSGSSTGDGNLVGTVLDWSGLAAPSQYAFAYGQEISRTTYSVFLTAITKTQSVTCVSGSPSLTSVVDTSSIPVGAVVEATCLSPGATVISKTSSTLTMSSNAIVSTTASAVMFPWGNGNGSTTFNVPDLRGVVMAGRPNMGGVASSNLTSTYCGENPEAINADCGAQSKTLIQSNLPNATLTVAATGPVRVSGVQAIAPNSGSTPITAAPGANTIFNVGAFGNIDAVSSTGTTSSINGGVTQTAFSIIQPTKTINKIVKILPDTSNLVATGVMSLGGMTGAIECGSGLICTGNIISSTVSASVTCGTGLNCSGDPVVVSLTTPVPTTLGGTGAASFTAGAPMIGNGTNQLIVGAKTGNTTVFGTSTGFLTSGNCVAIDADGNFVDHGSTCGAGANVYHVQTFASPADFTPGTTNSLVLSSTPTSSNELQIMFDGIVQAHNTWSLIADTITFDAVIPLSVAIVEATWSQSSTLAGVGSLGGMTGSVSCGTGLLCSSNTISNTGVLSLGAMTGVITCGVGLLCGSGTIVNQSVEAPGGRLTLYPGLPIQPIDVTGSNAIYYNCYHSNYLPIPASYVWATFTIPSCQMTLNLNSGLAVSNSIYDVYAINVGGTATLCYAGVGWSTGSRSGANVTHSTMQIGLNEKYWTNITSITNCYGGASGNTNYGPIAIGSGLYLGSFLATASGQTSMTMYPAAVLGGTNTKCGVFNAYNREEVTCFARDLGTILGGESGWDSTGAGSWTTCNAASPNSGTFNRVWYIDPLGEVAVKVLYKVSVVATDPAFGFASTIGYSINNTDINVNNNGGRVLDQIAYPAGGSNVGFGQNSVLNYHPNSSGLGGYAVIGLNFVQCLENGINARYYSNDFQSFMVTFKQ